VHANSAFLDVGNAFTNVFISCDEDDIRDCPLFGQNDQVANEKGVDALLARRTASYLPKERASPENRRGPNVTGAEMQLPRNTLWNCREPTDEREGFQERRIPDS
jgi:hypothetical protein